MSFIRHLNAKYGGNILVAVRPFRALGFAAASSLLLLSACTSVGPSRKAIEKTALSSNINDIRIINIADYGANAAWMSAPAPGFYEQLGNAMPVGMIVGRGDILEVSIWEAPPAALFGSALSNGASTQTSRSTTLPEFLVGPSGTITVPFSGDIQAAGRTLPQIEKSIVSRLSGKAHQPQAIVRLVSNATANVTVIGEVAQSRRIALTPKGERLLDAIAAAGGTKQSTDKMTIQISRDGNIFAMPLDKIIKQPKDNIILKTDDVITAIYQPYSFTILGASGRNEEIKLEATGVSLAQAMGRVGGLQDGRADPKGVFLFRWEMPQYVPDGMQTGVKRMDGRIPVIYQIDMKDPGTYFTMQNFPMVDGDIIFVANSSVSEIQRFAGIIASTVLPLATLENSIAR